MTYTKNQLTYLVILRLLIGWHFLYEGVVKLWNPEWSSKGFMMSSEWIFEDLFQTMAQNEGILSMVDFINVWGLTIIGLLLILGLFNKAVSIGGVALLAMYYLAHPPLVGIVSVLPTEGSYLIVNKNLIELFALLVICAFPTSHIIGIEHLIAKFRGAAIDESTDSK